MVEIAKHFDSEELARTKAREALLPGKIAPQGRVWTSFVVVMRVVLPAIAIIFGLTALIWPLMQNQEISFTLSREDVARSDGVVKMQDLVYVGTLDNMQIFRLQAAEGLQDTPNAPRITLKTIEANMELNDGVQVSFEAGEGVYETRSEILTITEAVTLITTNGYRLNMSGAIVNIKEQSAIGTGPVTGDTPVGTLAAGRVELIADQEEASFLGGVKLHIKPRRVTASRVENSQ